MSRPADFIRVISERSKSMEIECIVISLDLMYIWYYQPCAQHAFLTELKRMSAEERLVLSASRSHSRSTKKFQDCS